MGKPKTDQNPKHYVCFCIKIKGMLWFCMQKISLNVYLLLIYQKITLDWI